MKSSVYSKQIGGFKKMTFWLSVANTYMLFPPHLSKFPPISPPLGGVAFPSHPENPNENPDSAWKVILNVCACIKIPCVAKVPIKCCGAWARFSVLPQQPTSCYNYLAHFCSSLHVAGLIHPCYRAKLLNFLHIFFHIIKFGGVSNPSFKSLNFIQYFILKAPLSKTILQDRRLKRKQLQAFGLGKLYFSVLLKCLLEY